MTLDQFDLAILRLLQQNNMLAQRDIGEAVHLSAASVNRRIKAMNKAGVIQANVAVIDPAQVNQGITLFVEVEMATERQEFIDEAKQRFREVAAVQQCYYVTGEADFMLVIVVSTMTEYEQLTRQLFFANSNVKRFRTFVTMDRVKVGLSVSIPVA